MSVCGQEVAESHVQTQRNGSHCSPHLHSPGMFKLPFTPLHPALGLTPSGKLKPSHSLLPPARMCLQPPEALGRVEREEQSPSLHWDPKVRVCSRGAHTGPMQGQLGSRCLAGTLRGNCTQGTAMSASAAPPHRPLELSRAQSVWQGCQGLRAEDSVLHLALPHFPGSGGEATS